MLGSEHDRLISQLKEDVDTARLEFDLAKEALALAAKDATGAGMIDLKKNSVSQSTSSRYNRAVLAYRNTLQSLANALLGS